MRYRFLILFLLASLTACTFQVQVMTPETNSGAGPTFTPPPFSTVTALLPQPFIQSSATPLPLPTLEPTFTATPLPVSLGTVPIQFAPGGTYVDLVDGLHYGTSKTYSIEAQQGQVISVSVYQNNLGERTVVPLRIVGADGSRLCPLSDNEICYVWRGTLPATQAYFVTLTPVTDVAGFTLRVAVNPPGTAFQTFQYTSMDQTISIAYTDEFAPVRPNDLSVFKVKPELELELIDPVLYRNTNLVEAHVLLGASADPAIVQSCLEISPSIPNERMVDTVTINGRQFVHTEGGGAATGNFYEQIMYRTRQSGICYELGYLIHSFNLGALAPGSTVVNYDRDMLLQKLNSILSTLVIRN
jgi:hypothetical protein